MARRVETITLGDYLRHTREASFNVLMVVFLLAIYEAGTVLTGNARRNAADWWLKRSVLGADDDLIVAFHVALMLLTLAATYVSWRRERAVLRHLPFFLVESWLWAGLLSPALFFLQAPFLARPAAGDLVLDLGAGVYEEIVFRFLLIRGVLFLFQLDPWQGLDEKRRGKPPILPLVVAIVFSSAAFAAYHHVGGGEPWDLDVLVFRFLAGLLLAGIYFWRGLAVAVYAHAFYDVLAHVAA